MRRPDVFTLDYSHPLAQGLVFAGLGNMPGTAKYQDASLYYTKGELINYTPANWQPVNDIGRLAYSGKGSFVLQHTETQSAERLHLVKFQPKTISGWFCARGAFDTIRQGILIGKAANYTLGFYDNGISFAIYDSGGIYRDAKTTARPWVVGEWVHIAGTYSESNIQSLYVNGTIVSSGGWSGWASTAQNNNPLTLRRGHVLEEANRVAPGDIADAIIHNRVLSPSEIALLADRTDPMLGGLVREVNPVAYFDFGASEPTETTGTMSVTESGTDSFSATGQLLISGLMSVAETGVDAASILGVLPVHGALSAVETGADAFAAYGGAVIPVTGTMDVTESEHDTATILGQLLISGLMDVSEVGDDVFSAIGSALPTITGDMAASETGADIFAALGTVTDTAPITAAEVARIVRATPRMKTVTAVQRVKQVRYEVTRA